MRYPEICETILKEVGGVVQSVSEDRISNAVELIANAKRVFLTGSGRTGFVAKCFAMRLMHMGFTVYVLGETIAPSIQENDLLCACSGSGETESIVNTCRQAKRNKAKVLAFTAAEECSTASLSDCSVRIPSPRKDEIGNPLSMQPMGSLFEQSLLIAFDAMVLLLMEKRGKDSKDMYKNHANLE